MKKLITLCTILILSINMIGCSKLTLPPEKAVSIYLKRFENALNTDIEELINDPLFIGDLDPNSVEDSDRENNRLLVRDIMLPILESLEYEICESNINDNTATVKIKITALDLKPFIPEIIKNGTEEFMPVYLEEGVYSKEEYSRLLLSNIANKVKSNNVKKSTSEIVLGLEKDTIQWIISDDYDFLNILFGYIYDITPELLDDAMENYIKSHNVNIDSI